VLNYIFPRSRSAYFYFWITAFNRATSHHGRKAKGGGCLDVAIGGVQTGAEVEEGACRYLGAGARLGRLVVGQNILLWLCMLLY
jgi:hypothetical protein